MLRKAISFLPMVVVALGLVSGAAFASDACSPTNPNAKTAIVQIPEAGTPNTPVGGVADGWVLIYKDAGLTQLSREVYCRNNLIRFAASVGDGNFQANPECGQTACTRVAATGKLHQAALKSDTGNANRFVFAAKKNAFGLTGFSTLHTFTGCPDGAQDQSGVIQDANGNLYGTTRAGGNGICSGIGRANGTVYKLSPASGGGATETLLHTFTYGDSKGWEPAAGLAFDSSGNLWGQTIAGGTGGSCGTSGCGVIYELTPGSGSTWNESLIYNFLGYAGNYLDGSITDLTLNPSSGIFYGVSTLGNTGPGGAIFSLIGSTVNPVYNSQGNNYPLYVRGNLAIDSAGNLYGATADGGTFGEGDVYQVNPSTGNATTLYSFVGGLQDGCTPASEPILDAAGNIYGTTSMCNVYSGGNVWKLTPQAGGTYSYTQLYQFCTPTASNCTDGQSPFGSLAMDSFGNIYGTTGNGGDMSCGSASTDDYGGCGTLFMISAAPTGGCQGNTYSSNPSYCESVLHTFEDGTDGAHPTTAVTLAPDGNLYGTTSASSSSSQDGVVWGYLLNTLTVTLAGGGTGTVVATSPTSINCPGICSGPYVPGTVVTLKATAATGFTFQGWSGACSGTSTTCAVTMTTSESVTATFTSNNLQTTTTTLKSSPTSSSYGQSVTFTATVKPTSGSGTPTGTVTFYNTGTALGTGTVSSGVAKLSTTALPAGTDSITATYSGDNTYSGSTSSALNQTVSQENSTTALGCTPSTASYGQSVTCTATITPQYGGALTGTVTFYNGASSIGTATLSGTTATLTTSTLPVGTDSLTATYGGDANNLGSTSSAFTETVSGGTTTTALASSLSPSTYGENVTFTATITPQGGGSVTGTVTFYNGSSPIGTGPVSSNKATLTIGTLPVGTDSITATYGGDSGHSGSTSSAVSQTVTRATTTGALTSSLNPSNQGQSVTFTVTETGQYSGTPTGNVTFYNGTAALATVTLSGGTASYSTSALTAGTHSITAVYAGDSNFIGDTSPKLSQVVNKATVIATTTALTSSLNPSTYGKSVTFTATVTPSSGTGTPTGSVTFSDTFNSTTTTLGTVNLSGGVATYSTSALASGKHTIKAVYSGSSGYKTSNKTLTQTVNGLATTTKLTSSANPSTAGESVTFTATVAPASGTGTPTGSVTFSDTFNSTTTTLGKVNLSGGVATYSTSTLAAGKHTIKAVYSGDTEYKTSLKTLTQTVN